MKLALLRLKVKESSINQHDVSSGVCTVTCIHFNVCRFYFLVKGAPCRFKRFKALLLLFYGTICYAYFSWIQKNNKGKNWLNITSKWKMSWDWFSQKQLINPISNLSAPAFMRRLSLRIIARRGFFKISQPEATTFDSSGERKKRNDKSIILLRKTQGHLSSVWSKRSSAVLNWKLQ